MKAKHYRVIDSFGKVAYSGGDKQDAKKVFLSCKWAEPHEAWRIEETKQQTTAAAVLKFSCWPLDYLHNRPRGGFPPFSRGAFETNAVPPLLAKALGEHLIKELANNE